MSLKRKIIFIFLLVLLLAGIFSAGIFVGKKISESQCEICPPQEIDFSLFWEVYHRLQEKFVSPDKIETKKLIYGAISGMVKSVDDPYTVFFNPAETKRFIEDAKGSFEGIGIEIGMKKGQLEVVSPLEGTPAQKAGLRAGDKIIKINDVFAADITLEEAVNLIRGKKGTEVTLSILRRDWDKTKDFKIVRDVILVPSLKLEIKEDFAYLKLYHFSEKASLDFQMAALAILNSPVKKIVLDLRNNPGGYLEVAQDIAGWFLEKGKIVVIEDFGGKKERVEYKAEGNAKLSEYPVVLLINQGSASGAEILAGALRDNRNIKLLGEKSFGKGSVQELEKLREDASIKITVAKWLTPKGTSISDVGLEPDIKVEMTDEDYEESRDPQLDKAIEVIKAMR